jgi:hypothetical protein
LDAEIIGFEFDSFKEFKKGRFVKNVKLNFKINNSIISFSDLSNFINYKLSSPDNFRFSAQISGAVSNIKVDSLIGKYGENTGIMSSLVITGLPDIHNAFIYHDISSIIISPADIKQLNPSRLLGKNIKIPQLFFNLGLTSYKGNFTGFISDFVAYGTVENNLGSINTDLAIAPGGTKGNRIRGSIRSENANFSSLINPDSLLGKAVFDLKVDGFFKSGKDFNLNTVSNIKAFNFKNYEYNNIRIDGELTNQIFNGELSIADTNLDMDFNGSINYKADNPGVDFVLNVRKANLFNLNIDNSDSASSIAFSMLADYDIIRKKTFDGKINLSGVEVSNSKVNEYIDYAILTGQVFDNENSRISIKSDYLEAELFGVYDLTELAGSVRKVLNRDLPDFINFPQVTKPNKSKNRFIINMDLKKTGRIISVYYPDFTLSDNAALNVEINDSSNSLKAKFNANHLDYKGNSFDSLKGRFSLDENDFESYVFVSDFKGADGYLRNSILFSSENTPEGINVDLSYVEKLNDTSNLKALISSERKSEEGKFIYKIDIPAGEFNYDDRAFKYSKASVIIDSNSYKINEIAIKDSLTFISVDGMISENPDELMNVVFYGVNLKWLERFIKTERISFSGMVGGNLALTDFYGEKNMESKMKVDSFYINEIKLGNAFFESSYFNEKQKLEYRFIVENNNYKIINIKGDYSPIKKKIDFDARLNKIDLRILNQLFEGTLSGVNGWGSGDLSLSGNISNPLLNGDIVLQGATFKVDYLNTRYFLSHKISIENNMLKFSGIEVHDKQNNLAIVNGFIHFDKFKELFLDFNVNAENLLVLNTKRGNDGYFGTGFATGNAYLKGPSKDLNIDISLYSNKASEIVIDLNNSSSYREASFIRFVKNEKADYVDSGEDFIEQAKRKSTLNLDFDLAIGPETGIQLLFNSDVLDRLKGMGTGDLNMSVSKNGRFQIIGEFEFISGDFMLNFQNLITKKFKINQGSKINMTGEPSDADINLTAVYKLKTSLAPVFGDTSSLYKNRVPVDCEIKLQGKLTNPTTKFNIELPTVEPETRNKLNAILDTEEKISKQFLALVLFNSFVYEPDVGGAYASASSGSASGFSAVTGSEVLSNQVSSFLSQFNDNVDVGLYYRPGNEMASNEIEVALSTQIFNDRVSISGNLDMSENNVESTEQKNTNDLVGDFEVDVKLNKSGKLRVKAFHRANDDIVYDDHQHTQGIGISYKEDFDSFSELMRHYFRFLYNEKKDSAEIEK